MLTFFFSNDDSFVDTLNRTRWDCVWSGSTRTSVCFRHANVSSSIPTLPTTTLWQTSSVCWNDAFVFAWPVAKRTRIRHAQTSNLLGQTTTTTPYSRSIACHTGWSCRLHSCTTGSPLDNNWCPFAVRMQGWPWDTMFTNSFVASRSKRSPNLYSWNGRLPCAWRSIRPIGRRSSCCKPFETCGKIGTNTNRFINTRCNTYPVSNGNLTNFCLKTRQNWWFDISLAHVPGCHFKVRL